MVFCEIALRGLPRFDFAYCVTSENHNVEFRRRKDYLEISLQEEGISCREFTDGTKMLVLPKMLSSVFSDSDFCSTAANGEAQYHTTVGVKLAYSHIRHDTATEEIDILALQERLKNGHTFLIPETLALDADFTTILTLLKTIVACVNSPYSYDQIQAVSKWYKLCFLLTKIVLKELEANMPSLSPGAHQYVIKAKDHIYANYSRELTVAEIAGALRISPGYLHSIFKAEMGMGIIAFTNDYRMKIAQQLIEHSGLSLQEAALQVGISDPSYMSRLFKKTTGISYREFCQNQGKRLKIRYDTK